MLLLLNLATEYNVKPSRKRSKSLRNGKPGAGAHYNCVLDQVSEFQFKVAVKNNYNFSCKTLGFFLFRTTKWSEQKPEMTNPYPLERIHSGDSELLEILHILWNFPLRKFSFIACIDRISSRCALLNWLNYLKPIPPAESTATTMLNISEQKRDDTPFVVHRSVNEDRNNISHACCLWLNIHIF